MTQGQRLALRDAFVWADAGTKCPLPAPLPSGLDVTAFFALFLRPDMNPYFLKGQKGAKATRDPPTLQRTEVFSCPSRRDLCHSSLSCWSERATCVSPAAAGHPAGVRGGMFVARWAVGPPAGYKGQGRRPEVKSKVKEVRRPVLDAFEPEPSRQDEPRAQAPSVLLDWPVPSLPFSFVSSGAAPVQRPFF